MRCHVIQASVVCVVPNVLRHLRHLRHLRQLYFSRRSTVNLRRVLPNLVRQFASPSATFAFKNHLSVPAQSLVLIHMSHLFHPVFETGFGLACPAFQPVGSIRTRDFERNVRGRFNLRHKNLVFLLLAQLRQ